MLLLSIPRNTQLWLLTYFFSTYLELSSIVQFFHQNIHVIASLGHFPYCYYSYLAQWKISVYLTHNSLTFSKDCRCPKNTTTAFASVNTISINLVLHFQSRSLTFFESYRITMLNIGKWSNEEAICCFAFTNNTIERCGVVFCRCAFMIRWNTTDGNHDKDLLSIVRYRCCPAIEGRYCCKERVWVTIGTTIRKVK